MVYLRAKLELIGLKESQIVEEKALIPIGEQKIDFYGDQIVTAFVDVGGRTMMYVPLRPICEYLGLSWSGQRERTMRDPVLKEETRSVRVTRSDPLGRGDPDVICLPVEFLPGWLFGINATRVKPELKEGIIRYQRECFSILWQAFQSRAVTTDVIPQLVADQAETRARVSNLEQDMKAVKVILSEIRGLSTAHRATAKEMVDQISKISGTAHRYIWSDLNKAFHVAAYGDIQDEKWAEVQMWLQQRLDTAKRGKGIQQQPSLFDEKSENI